MSWFSRLFSKVSQKIVKTFEPENYRFVVALCENEVPQISKLSSLGYMRKFKLNFKEVEITVKYNTVRKEWDMEIWDGSNFLYYYDCLSPKPHKTINYLINKYSLQRDVLEYLNQKRIKNFETKERQKRLIDKYVKS